MSWKILIKKPLKNNIDFSLAINSSFNENSRILEVETPLSTTKSWSIEPNIRYTFSRTVEGSIRFEIGEREWRGIGSIPRSGYQVRKLYAAFDVMHKLDMKAMGGRENPECMAGQILKGLKKPNACPLFGKMCSPSNPQGAPMVSSEGACAAYYHYGYEPA